MIELDTERWVPVVHVGCGEKAFEINSTYINRSTRVLMSAWVKLPNGERPEPLTTMVCGTCGSRVSVSELKPSHILRAYEQRKPVMVA